MLLKNTSNLWWKKKKNEKPKIRIEKKKKQYDKLPEFATHDLFTTILKIQNSDKNFLTHTSQSSSRTDNKTTILKAFSILQKKKKIPKKTPLYFTADSVVKSL